MNEIRWSASIAASAAWGDITGDELDLAAEAAALGELAGEGVERGLDLDAGHERAVAVRGEARRGAQARADLEHAPARSAREAERLGGGGARGGAVVVVALELAEALELLDVDRAEGAARARERVAHAADAHVVEALGQNDVELADLGRDEIVELRARLDRADPLERLARLLERGGADLGRAAPARLGEPGGGVGDL